MVFELGLVQRAYLQVLEHQLKRVLQTLRGFPADRLDERRKGCAASLRELAAEFVNRVHRIDEIAYGRPILRPQIERRSRVEILLDLETAYLGARAVLVAMPPARWAELVPAPAGLAPIVQARRGELLWFALRDLIRHHRHLTLHTRGVCRNGRLVRTPTMERALDEVVVAG